MHLILYIEYTVYYYMPAFTNNFTYGQYMMRAKGINLILFCRHSSIQNFKLNKISGIRPDFFQISGKSDIRPNNKNHYPVHLSIYQSVISIYQSVISTYQSLINTYQSVINCYCILMSYFTPQFPSLQSPAHLMVFYTVEY